MPPLRLLLVDSDTRSQRVLEVSLRKAGFMVTAVGSVADALGNLELNVPDLIISETTFPDGNGFELRRRVRSTTDWAEIPFIFLTAQVAIENKIRGLELGVDDYLTKPIYIKEIVTRINILLQKRQRATFEAPRDGKTRFAGRVQDMPVVDVIQTIEISRKSGVIQFTGDRGRQAAIYFRDGKVIDAEAGTLVGEDAVYRLLTWSEGEFEVVFRTVRRRDVITMASPSLLMEGMRRLDEWSRLLEQIPPLTHRFEVDTGELSARLGDVPDDNNRILRLIDGKRTLLEVIDASDVGDLECLQAISRLYFEELLLDLDHGKPAQRDTGKPMPLVEVQVPTPIEEVASGPIQVPVEVPTALEPAIEPPAVAEAVAEAPPEVAAAPPSSEPEVDEGGAVEDEPLTPLLGGYRPSSLRLIDEAVAAAQAIEPSLFEDEAAEPEPPRRANGVQMQISEPEHMPPSIVENEQLEPEDLTPVEGLRRAVARDDLGLRMIGSLGRDRAEASGELRPVGAPPVPLSETQRELVTILPRRITREIPVTDPAARTLEAPPLIGRVATPESARLEAAAAHAAKPVEPPAGTPAHVLPAGSGVRAPSGMSAGVIALMVLAALLAGLAVFLRLKRHAQTAPALALADASQVAVAPPDATEAATAPVDAMRIAVSDARPADAAVATIKPDAAADKLSEAKALYDKAHDALEEGDFARAFELAEGSLKLRKTARTYLLLAQAEQRLDRVDDALASVESAIQIAPTYSAGFEVKGNILWGAGRYDDAREAYGKFLEMDPNSPKAPAIQRRLNEPR